MGYVFEFSDAVAYENWLKQDRNQVVVGLEHRLMLEMIQPVVGDSLIDIGCGTGASLEPFLGKGVSLTGIEPSLYMLDVAQKKIGHKADFHQAHAEDLPFDDNYFNYACLCLCLEFCDNPKKALEEACRVAKDGVFIGILNKYALKALQRRIRGIFKTTIYNRARFFSIGEIKQMLFSILGNVPVASRTVCQFPGLTHPLIARMESSRFAQRSPFGAFAGIMAVPVPRFRTTPLTLKCPGNKAAPSSSPAVSCAGELKNNYE
jgi:ubiquinone/menaquinone biosynthesis C-methylase UbiE